MDISTTQFGSLQQLVVNTLSPSGKTGCLPSLSPVLLRPIAFRNKAEPQVSCGSQNAKAEDLGMRLVLTLGLAGKSPDLGDEDRGGAGGGQLSGLKPGSGYRPFWGLSFFSW